MKTINPSLVIEALNTILPDYPKTNNLVSKLHDIICHRNNNLKTLLTEHSEYVSKTEDELSDEAEYNLTLEIYYYSCLFDLPSKYSLEEIFSTIDSIRAYDFIDKTFFKVLFRTISIEQAIDTFDKEIRPKNLISTKEKEDRVLIKWHPENDMSNRPNERISGYFRDSKIVILENLFVFMN